MTTPTPLLAVTDLRVAFGGHEVVHGVSFEVQAGEKIALVGESGSGKTVTALALMRLLQNAQVQGQAVLQMPDPSERHTQVDLLHAPEPQMRALRGRDMAMVFQEPMTAMNPLMTIKKQISEIIQKNLDISDKECDLLAIEYLAKTSIQYPEQKAESYPHQLSGGQRQRAMMAMALACQPRLLLADEPTTALDVTVRAQILTLITNLQRAHGMAVMLITHDLNLVRRFADRIVVMEKGHIVEQGPVASVFAQPQHTYTRKLLDSVAPRNVLPLTDLPAAEPLLWTRELQVDYPVPLPGFRGWFRKGYVTAVQGVNLQIRPGQTLGVVGESGSGKTTLALAALGLLPHQGELGAYSHRWGTAVQGRQLRQTVQVVFQDPFSSLSPRMAVEDIVGEGLRVHCPELSKAERARRVLEALQEVGLAEAEFPRLLQRYPHEFSGGQRQRIAIARALIVQPELLVLDEPTSALDVTIQKQVIELLQQLQRQRGLAYLLITHDVAVIQAMAHHVMVMRDARVVEQGLMEEVFAAPQAEYTRSLLASAQGSSLETTGKPC
ncbi:MAG: hypothetical protein RLZZ126_1666 [Pseudomonadota bacterium]